MIPFDLPPKPALWTPPKPAIIRAADLPISHLDRLFDRDLLLRQRQERLNRGLLVGTFAASSVRGLRASAAAAAPFGITFIGSSQNLATTASVDFTTIDIGAADASRVIILGVGFGNGNADTTTISSVTINGVAATRRAVAQKDSASVIVTEASIWTAPVPTGTSVTINVTASAVLGAASFRTIHVHRMVGGTEAPTGTATAIGTTSASASTIDCPAGGAIVGMGTYLHTDTNEVASSASKAYGTEQTNLTVGITGGSASITWSELTEDSEQDMTEVISGSARAAVVMASFGA